MLWSVSVFECVSLPVWLFVRCVCCVHCEVRHDVFELVLLDVLSCDMRMWFGVFVCVRVVACLELCDV